jgi:hypothetical protein
MVVAFGVGEGRYGARGIRTAGAHGRTPDRGIAGIFDLSANTASRCSLCEAAACPQYDESGSA